MYTNVKILSKKKSQDIFILELINMMIFVPLELEVNKHMEKTNVTVTDLNGIDMFLEYDWLVKHNSEIN